MIDLRSDTVTQPSPEMRRAMYEAELGDDVYGEDPTVNRLEAMAAERTGKEAAMLVVSGTMGNLVCGLAHCQRGDEMIVGADAHIFVNEAGSVASLGGVQVRTIPNDERGMLDPDRVQAAIRPVGLQFPRTALVCLENTHNRCSGAVLTPDYTDTIARIAHQWDAAVHLDGARLFNAAVYLDVPPRELVRSVDSVMFCFSKGLCCPVGSIICGTKEFIQRAQRTRNTLGGGMRQVGVLATAALVALEEMVYRLADDHHNARRLAEGLSRIPGIILDPAQIQTNIVIFQVADGDAPSFLRQIGERGLLGHHPYDSKVRMVTHYGIDEADVDEALEIVELVMKERLGAPRS